MKKEVKI